MKFILSEEQRNIIISSIENFPLKNTFQAATILFSLPVLNEEDKEIKKD